jgi:purine-binding chemotaxis protein CheW
VAPRESGSASRALICRVGAYLCAVPLASAVETMRPLPVEPLGDAPDFIAGVSIIRGAPVPVVDLAAVLGIEAAPASRLVTVRAGGRLIALAVSEVLGVRSIDAAVLSCLPPLLREARPGVVSSMGVLDTQALLVLEGAHIVPDEVWAELALAGTAQQNALW